MTIKAKSFVARMLLGVVALTGIAAAVPASAHPYDGRDWSRDRGWVERGYGRDYDRGYHLDRRIVRYDHAYDRGYDHGYARDHDRRW
jgi:hypothetical protein